MGNCDMNYNKKKHMQMGRWHFLPSTTYINTALPYT